MVLGLLAVVTWVSGIIEILSITICLEKLYPPPTRTHTSTGYTAYSLHSCTAHVFTGSISEQVIVCFPLDSASCKKGQKKCSMLKISGYWDPKK